MSDMICTRETAAEPFLASPPSLFREQFNRRSFELEHNLCGHKLFEMPRLLELALTVPNTYYDVEHIKINQRWSERARAKITLRETFERIREVGAWVVIRHAEKDPEYKAILDQCIQEIWDLSGQDLRNMMKSREAIIFITSPQRLTSYHIDRECNFLLQIGGDKQISIFDREDRELVTEEELERFWTVDNDSAIYKPHLDHRGRVYHLTPGNAVHIPVNCPHWLRNGDDVSISLSVSFQFPDHVRGDIYRANYYLRKLGIAPLPPGASERSDSLKRRLGGPAADCISDVTKLPAAALWRYREWKHARRMKQRPAN